MRDCLSMYTQNEASDCGGLVKKNKLKPKFYTNKCVKACEVSSLLAWKPHKM